MIKMRIKDAGVLASADALIANLTSTAVMGRVMRFAANAIWVPNIEERLFNTDTSQSNYSSHLYKSMKDLSPEFVKYLGNSTGWADVMEWERRVKGGYKEGEISEAISLALKSSEAMNIGGILAVGIGNLNELKNVMSRLDGDSKYKLWEIVQFGTGTYAGKGEIIRVGKQIFYDEKKVNKFGEHGIMARVTKSPGFKGREYFVQLDGTMHESDIVTKTFILNYINRVIKRYSYKGSGARG